MKLRTITAAATFLTGALFVGYVGTVHADPPKQITPIPGAAAAAPLTRKAAPQVLDAAKRVARFNLAMKTENIQTGPLPAGAELKLTPVAPAANGGAAEIDTAGPMHFFGASPSEPDGSYLFMPSTTGVDMQLHLPTSTNKFYIMDCRVQSGAFAPVKVRVTRNNKASDPPLDDGHVVFAFQATTSSTILNIAFLSAQSVTAHPHDPIAYFYGCEFLKALIAHDRPLK